MLKLLKRVQKQGFDVYRLPNGHWRVVSPDNRGELTLSFSPRSAGLKNTIHHLKKLGYDPGK